jgi:site-specific DNA-methyltransferase (adenine-specific)
MLGDSRFLPLKSESVDCVITSPPYWSLRKYDIPDLIWDGEEGCEHEWGKILIRHDRGVAGGETAQVGNQKKGIQGTETIQGQFCGRCGAWRGQLGLEPTFELYLKHLLEIFDEVKRVLKPTGTCWVNLGDSYSGSGCGTKDYRTEASKSIQGIGKNVNLYKTGGLAQSIKNIQAKSLILIPYRFAIAMIDPTDRGLIFWRADGEPLDQLENYIKGAREKVWKGFICRNLINWWKRNCMPSSAKDRFTVDFEPVFFFVKNRKYWFEQQYDAQIDWGLRDRTNGKYRKENLHSKNGLTGKLNPQGRNKRCVWDVPTQPYSEAHFATFPEYLVEPMIRAGCPKGGIVLDPFCGSGTMMRVAEKLSRVGIGFDLGYQDLQKKRIKNIQKELL